MATPRQLARGAAEKVGLLDPLRRIKWEARVEAKRWRQRARFRRWDRQGLPVVFANAMAKSGSHILSQFLEGLAVVSPLVYADHHPIRTYDERGQEREPESVLRDLRRLKAGDMGWGYLPSKEPYLRWFRDERVAGFFVYRDPRDKIISHIFYAMEIHEGHAMRDYYRRIDGMEERIEATIHGVPGLVENVRQTYESYRGWFGVDRVLKVRFEDLVNEQAREVDRLLNHLEAAGLRIRQDRAEVIDLLREAMAPKHSPTFRSGQSGGWQEHFTRQNIRSFKEAAGDLLVQLGYERDDGWG